MGGQKCFTVSLSGLNIWAVEVEGRSLELNKKRKRHQKGPLSSSS